MNGMTGHIFVGRALKARRVMRALTLEQLANKCAISVSYLSLIERGERTPNISVFITICMWLEVEPSKVMALAEEIENIGEFHK